MRHNRRPVITASALPPNRISVLPRGSTLVACPDCGMWRGLRRSMISPHRAEDGVNRCPGSAQRIRVDITPQEWREALEMAENHAGMRRSSGDRPADPQIERVSRRVETSRATAPADARRAPAVPAQSGRPVLSRELDHGSYRDDHLRRCGWQDRYLHA